MLTVAIGLVGALISGAADFLGDLAAKRVSVLQVTAIVAASGLVVLIAATSIPLLHGNWSWSAVLLGGLSGVTSAAAVSLLYGCLAIGPMSILSPTTAVVTAMVPVAAGAFQGERLEPLGFLAIALALAAVVLVGFVPDRRAVRPSAKALLMAVGSGAMIGAFIILIDLTPKDSGLVPLIANRAVNGLIMLLAIMVVSVVALRRQRATADRRPFGKLVTKRATASLTSDRCGAWRGALTLALVGGVSDAVANVLLLVGLRLGELTVMSVLTALYPAGTMLLAALVLKERIASVQIVGLALAIVAASMLTLV